MPLADDLTGIHGIVPSEGLLTFRNELHETLLDIVHNIVDIGNQNKE